MKKKLPHKRYVKLPKKRVCAEDAAPVEPPVIKSPSRRYETPDTRPNSQSLANRPPEYGGED